MGVTLTDVLLFGKAQSDDVDNATLVIYRRNILRWSAIGGYLDIIVKGVSPLSLPDAVANSLSYVKAFGGTEQRNLPSGYTQLEYLGSDSQAYIDTGIAGGKDTLTIECKFMYDTFVGYGGIYGNYVLDSHNGIRCILANSGNKIITNNNTICTTSGNTELNCAISQIHTVISKHDTVILDGVATSIQNTATGTENANNIALFNRSITNPNTSRDIGLKVYGFKIYDADVLVSNLIPCRRKSDSILGMYDTVSRHFFTNAGTGDFIAGADVTAPSPDTPMDIVSNNGVLKYSHNKINVITNNVVVGKYISAQGVLTDSEYNFTYMPYVPVKPNTTYTLSFSSPVYFSSVSEYSSAEDSGFVVRQTKYSTSLDAPFDLTEFTFTTGATTNYIRFGSNMYKNQSLTIDDVLALNYMLAESATAVPYAPYVSDNGGIYTDGTVETIKDTIGNSATCEPLLAVGDYTDVQSILDGVVTRNVGVMVLDGTENWTEKDQYNRVSLQITDMLDSTSPRSLPAFCNYFENLHNGEPISTVAAGQFYLAAPKRVYFHISQATAADFKQWLADQYAAGTPVILVYPLAEPTTEVVAGQSLQVTQGDNTLEITQASMSGLELEAKYKAAVELTVQEVQDANLDPNVEVTIQ